MTSDKNPSYILVTAFAENDLHKAVKKPKKQAVTAYGDTSYKANKFA
jgi:hypothetical protein